jgi:tol-pal system protein YbgF
MRTRIALAIGAAIVLKVGASGCAGSGPYWSREDQDAAANQEREERAARLERQLVAEQGRNAALQAEVERLGRELALAQQVNETQGSAAAPAAMTPEGLDAPDTLSADVSGIQQEIEQSDLELAEEPTAERGPGRLPASPSDLSDAAGFADASSGLYERSLELLEQGRLAEAEAGFIRFLTANPGSDLADNAQFWLAESALRRVDIASALAGFRAVVENYPEANKVPDALLKVGFCLAELGEPASAAMVYRELLERFPETTAAETARLRLDLR